MGSCKKLMGAVVALNDHDCPDITAVVDFLNANFAELLGAVRETPESAGNPPGDHILEFEDGKILLRTVKSPIPWTDLAVPCSTAWWWSEAEKELRPHRAKVEVSLYATRLDALHAALVTTAFTAAVAAKANAAGVQWNKGWVVQHPEHFIEAALKIPSGHLPTDCWIHLPVSVQHGKTTVVTTGMAGFHLPEVEAIDIAFAPRLVVGRILSFIAYLLQNGPIVKDGHSIGYSDQEQIRVTRTRSAFRADRDVFRLEFKKLLVPV